MLVHRRVTASSKFIGDPLYTWVKRGTVKIKCFAQEHNKVPRPGLEPGQFDPESSALIIRPPSLPRAVLNRSIKLFNNFRCFLFFLSNQDPTTNTRWMIYDKATGKPVSLVDSYKPQDGSTTIFRLVTDEQSDPKSSGKSVLGMGLVPLCVLAAIEPLMFL